MASPAPGKGSNTQNANIVLLGNVEEGSGPPFFVFKMQGRRVVALVIVECRQVGKPEEER